MISPRFQGKPLIPLYATISNVEEAEIEWFILETNQDHTVVFEIGPNYCISYPSVDYVGYSISSKGFLPTVVDIMVL